MDYYIVMIGHEAEKVNVGKVKEHFSSYVAKVEKGERVIVCRRNRPVAELVSIQGGAKETNQTNLGSARGSVTVKCDLTQPVMDEGDWEMLT